MLFKSSLTHAATNSQKGRHRLDRKPRKVDEKRNKRSCRDSETKINNYSVYTFLCCLSSSIFLSSSPYSMSPAPVLPCNQILGCKNYIKKFVFSFFVQIDDKVRLTHGKYISLDKQNKKHNIQMNILPLWQTSMIRK